MVATCSVIDYNAAVVIYVHNPGRSQAAAVTRTSLKQCGFVRYDAVGGLELCSVTGSGNIVIFSADILTMPCGSHVCCRAESVYVVCKYPLLTTITWDQN